MNPFLEGLDDEEAVATLEAQLNLYHEEAAWINFISRREKGELDTSDDYERSLALEMANLENHLAILKDRIDAKAIHDRDQQDVEIKFPTRSNQDDLQPVRDEATRECLACMDAFRDSKLIRCPCSHDYCVDCLNDLFEKSLIDESLFPPRCCGQTIPLDSTWAFVDDELLDKFKHRELEMATPNRTYCCMPACSTWIPPANIHHDLAVCPKPSCGAHTCVSCKEAMHRGSNCPKDEELLSLASREGWKRCPSCRRVIELNTGCYHMSTFNMSANEVSSRHPSSLLDRSQVLISSSVACICRAEFCYLCGMPWVEKSLPVACGCPLFDERHLIEPGPPPPPPPCVHDWRTHHGPGRCNRCRDRMHRFIEECGHCDVRMCRRCAYNRV